MKLELSPIIASRLEKAAIDNGFDRELSAEGAWLSFASTQCPMQIWLSVTDSITCLAISQANVAAALSDQKILSTKPLPSGALACLSAADISELHHLIRRAFQLSRTLPDEPLQIFERKTRALPRTTEAERLVTQRIGQDIFRDALIEYWAGSCAVTGVTFEPVLRASHMKPWSRCDDDAERLNVFNGVLLVANLDALFDQGLVSFGDDAAMLISPRVSAETRKSLGLDSLTKLRWISAGHLPYVRWHRDHLFEY